jgi:hypothetical protein
MNFYFISKMCNSEYKKKINYGLYKSCPCCNKYLKGQRRGSKKAFQKATNRKNRHEFKNSIADFLTEDIAA